ncbi:hypothetical protein LDR49_003826 [Salmonella enterica]|uniref:Penicillin-binding protein activator LpoB n=1 Tax=Salmonella enterica TaxID=28901 RepID=A0A5U7LUU2_SALER|nr:hypothetical protein [Salmonella enterica]EBP3305623.1 hypothetical protein [Salmonella enterica subsp. enterica]ELE3222547.1 hypothetical protein [Salmonella enterica subsp. enterica serovar Rubislaw]EAX8478867.1 hypothetical protein [Salmonella enterica]EBR4142582.1 hypothetical protein [Salmonella enterica]
MKRIYVCITGCLLAGSVLSGCSITEHNRNDTLSPSVAEVNQGVLGDLNQYVWQLLGQSSAGNGEAEKVLVRLLDGKGLPEPAPVTDKKV